MRSQIKKTLNITKKKKKVEFFSKIDGNFKMYVGDSYKFKRIFFHITARIMNGEINHKSNFRN